MNLIRLIIQKNKPNTNFNNFIEMKRIILVLSLVLGINMIYAQTSKEIKFDQYAKKIEKSNAEIQDPKKSIKDGTWFSRAELMMDVYDAQILRALTVNATTQTFNILIGNPLSQTQEVIDGVAVDKFEMERVNFYFVNGKLEMWEVTKPLVSNPLDLALESIKKVVEIDVNAKKTKKVKENLIKLKDLYISEGSNYYSRKDYKNAFFDFSKAIEIGQMPQLNQRDSVISYYTALSAQLVGDFENAIKYYDKAIEYNFTSDGTAYYYAFDAFKSLGKADDGVKYLEEGFVKFPKNTNILFGLIQYYVDKGEDPAKVLTYIDKALTEEPNNPTLHFAKGTVYDRLNDSEEAAKCYTKAIEIDANFFDAYYNLGAVYFNNGVKLVDEANKVPAKDYEKYESIMAKSNVEFKKALPYMEKAYEINNNSKETIEALKNIYFRFRSEGEEMNKKFQEYNEKLKNM